MKKPIETLFSDIYFFENMLNELEPLSVFQEKFKDLLDKEKSKKFSIRLVEIFEKYHLKNICQIRSNTTFLGGEFLPYARIDIDIKAIKTNIFQPQKIEVMFDDNNNYYVSRFKYTDHHNNFINITKERNGYTISYSKDFSKKKRLACDFIINIEKGSFKFTKNDDDPILNQIESCAYSFNNNSNDLFIFLNKMFKKEPLTKEYVEIYQLTNDINIEKLKIHKKMLSFEELIKRVHTPKNNQQNTSLKKTR